MYAGYVISRPNLIHRIEITFDESAVKRSFTLNRTTENTFFCHAQ